MALITIERSEFGRKVVGKCIGNNTYTGGRCWWLR